MRFTMPLLGLVVSEPASSHRYPTRRAGSLQAARTVGARPAVAARLGPARA